MTITAWRIVSEIHRDSAFDGEGAQEFGDRWIESGASVALAVPSMLLSERLFGAEYNILLNPRHEGFASIDIGQAEPLRLDARL